MVLTSQQRSLMRRETAISAGVNMIIGGGLFVLIFGVRERVELAGLSSFALDFLPQTFMTTLVGSLIPGLIASRRVRRGHVRAVEESRNISLLFRSVLLAVAVTALLGGAAILACFISGADEIPWLTAVAFKAFYGAAIGLLVTPSAVLAGLKPAAARPNSTPSKLDEPNGSPLSLYAREGSPASPVHLGR